MTNFQSKISNYFRLDPDYANAIYNKGDIFIYLNRIDEGIYWMSKAIEKRPNWPLYYCNRVKQYVK